MTRHGDVDGLCTYSGTPGVVGGGDYSWGPDCPSGIQVLEVGLDLDLDLGDLLTAVAVRIPRDTVTRTHWFLSLYPLSLGRRTLACS